MKALSLLIKPASGLCNMRCSYCFYREELAHARHVRPSIMTEELAELLIERICREAEQEVRITFQGGEPTLAGLDFLETFVRRLEQKKKPRLRVHYAIQTNGLTLDGRWAEFFRRNRFLVGLSFDGTAALHDKYRRDAAGKGTAARVRQSWQLLQKAGVETNLLCVITAQAARSPGAVYRYLRQLGAQFVQFIPCISPEGAEWALNGEDYGDFLTDIFDLWYGDWKRGRYISIRAFDDYVNLLCGRCPSTCAAEGRCGGYLVVESDGSLYPCDFYVEDGWYLGALTEQSFEDVLCSEKAAAFRTERVMPEACRACPYVSVCRGGCKNDCRSGENQYCQAYRRFFRHALPRLLEIAKVEKQLMLYQ